MSTTAFQQPVPSRLPSKRSRTRHTPPPRPLAGSLALWAAVLGAIVVTVVCLASEGPADLRVPDGLLLLVGNLAGLVGMYLALVMLVVIARIPLLERIVGQDGMVRMHRRLGPWPISLITAHAVLVTMALAASAKSGTMHELGALIRSYPDMLAATVALGMMIMAGVVSIRAIRSRLRRETWWVIHLYMYLALALSFAHVIVLGPTFVGHPLTRALWSVLWVVTAGTVLLHRFGLPIFRSLRHQLQVVEILREGPDVVSIICKGRRIDRLAVSGGQFFCWRFFTRGMWWQAHPYSLSAMPQPPYIRLTVRQVGDHSDALATLKPGTRVAIEGPYGAVTRDARRHGKVALLAGGIGITALRALLEDLPSSASPIVLVRASTEEGLVLRDEVADLVRKRTGSLHELVGSRRHIGPLVRVLRNYVPDLVRRDVYVCGSEGFVNEAVSAAMRLGVTPECLHYEVFSW